MEYLLYSDREILEGVDEYSLYCSYLGYQPLIGGKYQSPIRSSTNSSEDTNPSFGIYERKYGKGAHEFMWKDQSLGRHGDIFDLVKILYNLHTKRDAMIQVLIDSDQAPGQKSGILINTTERQSFVGYSEISIESKPFDTRAVSFWGRLNVDRTLLSRYDVRNVKSYWLYSDQAYPRYPKGLGFAYPVFDRYQLYQPWAQPKAKFRTDWTDYCVPGYQQLEYNQPLLIITKSMKDVMVLRSLGYEAISPRGESILLPQECVNLMKTKYLRILVLFDNDMKHRGDEYEFDKIYVPKITDGDKDTSDFLYNHGAQATAEMLRTITGT